MLNNNENLNEYERWTRLQRQDYKVLIFYMLLFNNLVLLFEKQFNWLINHIENWYRNDTKIGLESIKTKIILMNWYEEETDTKNVSIRRLNWYEECIDSKTGLIRRMNRYGFRIQTITRRPFNRDEPLYLRWILIFKSSCNTILELFS